MVMDWKGINYDLFDSCAIGSTPLYNPRAEIPVLVDGDQTVCNSADILGYLDRKHPELEIYPTDAVAYAKTREWERISDTLVDAIVTDVAIYSWAEIPPAPAGLMAAAKADLCDIYDQLEALLVTKSFVAGDLGVGDFALYPHLMATRTLNLGADPMRHGKVIGWLKSIRETSEGQADLGHIREWWADRANQQLDTKRVNWGTHRLEWFLSHGFLDRFIEEVRGDRVLWSVGPNSNARNSPLSPKRAESIV
jgi:glutathione S-transferase